MFGFERERPIFTSVISAAIPPVVKRDARFGNHCERNGAAITLPVEMSQGSGRTLQNQKKGRSGSSSLNQVASFLSKSY
jgi:hypothetical protein